MFCTKAPSIFTMSTPSLRKLRNDVLPAPKSSIAAAEILQSRDRKPRTSSRSWIATVSVISTISRSPMPGCAHQRLDGSPQSGSIVVSGEC